MQFFYEEQLHRMECMGQEPVLFEDILCQIVDMISPEVSTYSLIYLFFLHSTPTSSYRSISLTLSCLQKDNCVTLRDLKGCKLSGNVLNVLFNLNKFMAFETRDPFLIRQVK